MSDAYTVILCCERVEDAVSAGEESTLRHRLQELTDVLADDQVKDPAYEEIVKKAIELADLATDRDKLDAKLDMDANGSGIPEELKREVNALTHRVARCYLRSTTSGSNAAEDLAEYDMEAATTDEGQPVDQADPNTEAVSWRVRANALVEEQSPDTTDGDEIISQLQTAKSHLESGEKKEARRQLRKVRKQVKNTTGMVSGYSKSEFLSLLQMAESDAKLSRSTILDDIISDLSTNLTPNKYKTNNSTDENNRKPRSDSV